MSRPRDDPVRRWSIGLLVGLVVGVGSLVGGPLAATFGLMAAFLVAWRAPRDAPVGGLALGFGLAWVALFARADLACGVDCVGPDLRAWYLLGGALVVFGVVLTVRVARRRASGVRP